MAKRLYRLLDKRFYHGDEVGFNLNDLAFPQEQAIELGLIGHEWRDQERGQVQ